MLLPNWYTHGPLDWDLFLERVLIAYLTAGIYHHIRGNLAIEEYGYILSRVTRLIVKYWP